MPLSDCIVCGEPLHGVMEDRFCDTCREFRALLRAYMAQVPHVSALSLKRLLAEARKP